jgi:hypothetical protein
VHLKNKESKNFTKILKIRTQFVYLRTILSIGGSNNEMRKLW